MSAFSWFNSADQVDTALIVVALIGAIIEAGVAVAAVINVHKELEETRKEKLEKYIEVFACVAAFFFLAEAILGCRSSVLLGIELENLKTQNLVLRARVEQLQARRIDIDQEKRFISYLKNYRLQTPVKVFVGERDGETDDYAAEIRTILDEAGYGSGKTNDIIELGDVRIPSSIGETTEDAPFVFEIYATNNDPKSMSLPGFKFFSDYNTRITYTSVSTPSAIYTNDTGLVLAVVDLAFQSIRVYPAMHGNNVYLKKPGDWGIFIPKKF
jgi:hypothetical protein